MAENNKNYINKDEQDDENLSKNSLSDYRSFLFLFRFFKKAKRDFITGILLTFISPVMTMLVARWIGYLVQEGLINRDIDKAILFSILILIGGALSVAFIFFGERFIIQGSSTAILEIRKELFKKLQHLPMKFYDHQPQGRIVTRVTHDVKEVEMFFMGLFGRFLSGTFVVIMAITFMFLTNSYLASVIMITIIPAVIFMFKTRKYIKNFARKRSRFSSKLNSKLSEYIDGVDVIRLFGLENWSKKNHDNIADEYVGASLEGNVVMSWTRPTLSLLTFIPLAGLVYFGGMKVIEGTITVSVFIAFFHYSQNFINPILQLMREVHMIQQAFVGAERLASFLRHDEEDEVLGADGGNASELSGIVEFKNVTMSYDTDIILSNLSFKIEKGEKIGFVGRTGCGKTTTVSLLTRLYDFQQGDILFDDHSIKDIQRDFLRQSIGYVSQDVVIFSGALRDNLLAGGEKNDHEVLAACEETGLLKVMQKNGQTLDSKITDAGANLSVGEKQLVSLTRVLLNDPAILILDEATANIDKKFEEIIHKAVSKIMKSRTCIMIAHRLDTLKDVDRVFVFDKGQIVESGNADELMDLKGIFYNLSRKNK